MNIRTRMFNSLMVLQAFSFGEDLTTVRARTNATRVSGETKDRVNHHSTLITTREPPEWHAPIRTTGRRIGR